jgi:hypothetical protein
VRAMLDRGLTEDGAAQVLLPFGVVTLSDGFWHQWLASITHLGRHVLGGARLGIR